MNIIDLFFSSRLMRFLMRRNKCPKGLEQITLEDRGYLRFKDWGDCIEYREIWVEPELRQQGYGTELIERLAYIARIRGYPEIYTIVHTDGKSDVLGKFITKNGFVPCKFKHFNFKKIV